MPNKVKIEIDGKNKKAITAINGVQTKLIGMQKQTSTLSRRMDASFTRMGGVINGLKTKLGLMGVAAIAGFGYMIKNAIDTAESLEKMSQRVGLSVEFLSTLRHATELSGTEISVMEKAIQRMSRTLFDANRGLLTAKIPFDELGVAVSNSMGQLRSGEVVLLEVADRFARMEDGTQKTALALQIFGRAGADLIPLLNQGAAGIRAMQEEARALGLEISKETAKNAAELKDNMLRLESSVTGVANKLADGLIPMLNTLVTSMSSIPTDLLRITGEAGALLLTIRTLAWAVNALNIKILASRVAFLKSGWGILIVAAGTLAAELLIVEESTEKLDEGLNKNTKSLDWMSGNLRRVGYGFIRIKQESAGLTDEQIKALEILNRQWSGVSSKLQKDVLLLGLNPQHAKMIELNIKAEEYRQKFGSIPGSLSIINDWYDQLILKAAQLNEIKPLGLDQPEPLQPGTMDTVDMTQMQASHDMQREMIVQTTDLEMISYGLRQGYAQTAFGNMSSMAMAFYQAGDQRSKAALAAYKAFAIGEAVMSTYLGAAAALSPPPIGAGPLWGPILAASTIAFGLANVARIATMQPGGGAGGGVPSYSAPSIPSTVNNTNNNQREIIQNITIVTSDSDIGSDPDRFARLLLPHIRKAVSDGG